MATPSTVPKQGSIFNRITGDKGSKLSARQASAAIASLCEELEYDPLAEMIKLAQLKVPKKVNGEEKDVHVLDAGSRFTIAKEILPYIAPKLKTVDLQSSDGTALAINVVNFAGQPVNPVSISDASDPEESNQLPSTPEEHGEARVVEAASSPASPPVIDIETASVDDMIAEMDEENDAALKKR